MSAGPFFTLDAEGNYFWSPKKFVAAIGVRDVVLVETEDAMLLCSRERSQDVGKIVKWLEERKRPETSLVIVSASAIDEAHANCRFLPSVHPLYC